MRFFKRFHKSFSVLGLMLLVVACTSEPVVTPEPKLLNPPKDLNADYRVLSMVTSGKENLNLQPGNKFFWLKPVEIIGVEDQGRAVLFKGMIDEELQRKGFKIVGTLEESDFQLSAAAVLGEIPDGQAFLLNPGLINESGKDKGSLMIFVHNPPPRVLWRGAAQVYTGEGLSQEFRVDRSRKAIHGLLRDVSLARR